MNHEIKRRIAERAAEFFVPRNLFFPGDESFFPFVVVFEETGEIPRVGGLDLLARRQRFDLAHDANG